MIILKQFLILFKNQITHLLLLMKNWLLKIDYFCNMNLLCANKDTTCLKIKIISHLNFPNISSTKKTLKIYKLRVKISY